MYLNWLQILLAFLATFLTAYGLGIVYSHGRGDRRQRKHQHLFQNFKITDLHLAFVDDDDVNDVLEEISTRLKASGESAQTVLFFLIEGVLRRRAGAAQKALRIHQSLLANPKLDADLEAVIRIQCALSLEKLDRKREAEAMLEELPRRWRKDSALNGLRRRLAAKSTSGGHPSDDADGVIP